MSRESGKEVAVLPARRRPLRAAERRLLKARMRRHERRSGAFGRSVAIAGVAVIGVFWVVTLLASDAPWWLVTAFWLVAGALIGAWVRRDLRRENAHLPDTLASLESAVRRNEVESFDIVAVAYVEFEEVEDEGACYAFDLGDGRLVFLAGQEFYAAARFPSLDFSVVYPLDEAGRAADMWIEKRGERAAPVRVVAAPDKRRLADEIPESLHVVPGTLDRLAEALEAPPL